MATSKELEWRLKYDKREVKVWTARDDDDNQWVKAETVVNASWWSLLNLLRDTDSAIDWIDNVIAVKVVPQPDPLIDLVYTEFYAPWPFLNRMMSTRSTLNFDTIKSSLSIEVAQHPALFANTELIAMEDVQGAWQAIKMNQTESKIIWTGTAKPGGNIPNWLARSEMKKSTYRTFLALRDKISEKKYQDKPSAYPLSQ
ncbi:hypothetical protein [Planctobacterium marinum]|uniref:START domain-containing protein n=1 Tax=Planctobacterium marinum TaxID=1631968 RepID=A0AA48HUW2_9ALTE|nr:hypothetical protein MACH26_18340 [Planctobacterium marinum]